MYPAARLVKDMIKFRNAPRLALGDTHVSQHVCWPWDIDVFLENTVPLDRGQQGPAEEILDNHHDFTNLVFPPRGRR